MCLAASAVEGVSAGDPVDRITALNTINTNNYILLATLEHPQLHQGGLECLLVLPAFPALQHKPALGRVLLA